jgi:hypothetical protein
MAFFEAAQVFPGDIGPAGKVFNGEPAALAQFPDTIANAPRFHFLEKNDFSVHQIIRQSCASF